MRLVAHRNGVFQAEVQHDLRIAGAVARLVEGVLDVRVQDPQSLSHTTRKNTSKKRVRGVRRYSMTREEENTRTVKKNWNSSAPLLSISLSTHPSPRSATRSAGRWSAPQALPPSFPLSWASSLGFGASEGAAP